jgi:hypothetical protein
MTVNERQQKEIVCKLVVNHEEQFLKLVARRNLQEEAVDTGLAFLLDCVPSPTESIRREAATRDGFERSNWKRSGDIFLR